MSDEINLKSNGLKYTGWISCEIKKSVRALSGIYTLKITDSWSKDKKGWFIVPGDFSEITIGEEPVITGYIDTLNYSTSSNQREISVIGRDKTADLVDCSIKSSKNSWANIRLEVLIRQLCLPFGIKVINSAEINPLIDEFTYNPGDSVHESLNELSKKYGFIAAATPQGDLEIVKVGAFEAHDDLIEGSNLVECNLTIDHKERFSEYIVKGQNKGTDEDSGLFQISRAKDNGIKRYRPIIIQSSTEGHTQNMSKRSEWEMNLRESKSTAGSVKLRGWRQSNGELWKPNMRVNFVSKYLGVKVEFLIGDVTYTLSESGRTVQLELLRKEVFLSEFNLASLDVASPEDQLRSDFWS